MKNLFKLMIFGKHFSFYNFHDKEISRLFLLSAVCWMGWDGTIPFLVSTKCGHAQNVAIIASNFASKKFNLHSKMGRVVVFRGNVDTKCAQSKGFGRELDVSWVNFLCSFDPHHFYCNLTLLIIDSRAVKLEEIT